MTKQEIIEAINSTIVANGQKGITAESLNNVLTEMVNATPEGGSGEGSGVLMLQANMDDAGNLIFTDEQIANNRAIFNHVSEKYGTPQCLPVFFTGYPVSIITHQETTLIASIFMFLWTEPLPDALTGEGTPIGVTIGLVINADGTIEIEM